MRNENGGTIVVLLAGCMGLLWYMWFSLAKEVESGRPFLLNNKYYQAREVSKP